MTQTNLCWKNTDHLKSQCSHKLIAIKQCNIQINKHANDPSAGSPTETLLRLLLPLSDKVYYNSYAKIKILIITTIQIIHRITQSVGATGGVYKGQGRNQPKLMTLAY